MAVANRIDRVIQNQDVTSLYSAAFKLTIKLVL